MPNLPARTALILLLTHSAFGAAGSLTIAQIMSAPFAGGLIAARTAQAAVWIENEQGRRNIWLARGPEWQSTKLTSFDDDDGQEIADLAWSPDSTYVLFTRGGDFENGGENPNPAVSARKPEQAIWRVNIAGGPPAKLTVGHSPQVSSKGEIIFLRDGQIFSLQQGTESVPLVEAKGSQSDLTWSPDGTRFSFVSDRHDHSFIGVYSFVDQSLRYLDPSVDGDSAPVWSPDSSSIAFLRTPALSEEAFFAPRRAGPPWSIRVADAAKGTGREIFHAADGPGSVFHALDAQQQFFWAGDRIVFPWERTGWNHLYSVATGRAERVPIELTPGNGEVENVAQSAGTGIIYYSSNLTDIDGRHLASVRATGASKPRQLTSGSDIEWQPAPSADGKALLYLASSYNGSSHPAVLLANGERKALGPAAPAEFPANALVKPQTVLVTAADGMQIHAQLFLPPETRSARHPALIFFHGGSRRQMLPGFHYMYYYSNAYSLNQYLASQGYVVLSVNYRSGIGYGLDFREAIHYGAQGGSEFNDVVGAGLYLKSRPDVDGHRIGVWGGSYGGYLTAMALSRASDLFAAGVDFHGVHDWSSLRGYLTREGASGDPNQIKGRQEAARIAFESSPMATVDTWRSPVLLIHGDDDRNVEFAQTLMLVEALRKRDVPFEELIFPNEIHDFLLHRHWVEAYQAAADFFARKLREPEQSARQH